MDLHESGEMYLETILRLKEKNNSVRSIDIATQMNFSKPSVSRAIKILKESELIIVDAKGYIEFTPQGRQVAEKIYNRHIVLTKFLELAGVSNQQAEDDACRIEHVISDETYECIKNYLAKQS